jgi:beta-galactosidase
LPRVGITLQFPKTLTNLAWYGHGPHDNYNDRKSSSIVAHHQSTVADQYVPYITPQEHGHKVDTRWLALTDAHGHGMRVWSPTRFEFSALPYSDAELTTATHTIELPESHFVHLNLDCGMRGLGTGLFVDTLLQYRLNERAYQFSFFIAPLA